MQGEINGTILGVDTLVIVVGTHTQVRRVMQLNITSEDIDWAQTPNDNPMLACVPFEEVFYQEVDIGSEVTITGLFKCAMRYLKANKLHFKHNWTA